MVTDNQIRRYFKLMQTEKSKAIAAMKAGMDEKTARKYEKSGRLPSELKKEHTWRTRKDPFAEVWEEIKKLLETNPGLESKTLFKHIQRQYPGKFSDGKLRTLQRRVKTWRALEGNPKEVYFDQIYKPGILCQSDFTHMNNLGITINQQRLDHLIYHFVLPYSNWESGTICFSESFESLSEGLQNALWELGGVPRIHQTDRLSAAVHKTSNPEEFTERYRGLLGHYGLSGRKIQSGRAHENGDVEQSHYRFKKALEQAIMLRGSRDFESRQAYDRFLKKLFHQLNANRGERFQEEIKALRRLPQKRLEACKRLNVKVSKGSTIRVNHNVYSVNSRLIGEWVNVRLYAEDLEVWYAQRCVEKIPRLRGDGNHHIQYRHIIDWLVRKPGAFENYRYRSDLFPTHNFRIAYDSLKRQIPQRASKEYLEILHLSARENETAVDNAIALLIDQYKKIRFESVKAIVMDGLQLGSPEEDVIIKAVDLKAYDGLLNNFSHLNYEDSSYEYASQRERIGG